MSTNREPNSSVPPVALAASATARHAGPAIAPSHPALRTDEGPAARPSRQSQLFKHVSCDRAEMYRAILDVFSAAKRQFRLHLRPDEVLTEAAWAEGQRPQLEQVQTALSQLAEWGNLSSQADTTRVASLEDFYRARFLYRLSEEGEATETAMSAYAAALLRRSELQSIALDDILSRLQTLQKLAAEPQLDLAKIHEALRDLQTVFTSLADNAQAFMAGVARAIELHRAAVEELMTYKHRLVDYLNRFIGDLIERSGAIAVVLLELDEQVELLLGAAARREMRDAVSETAESVDEMFAHKLSAWRMRWMGLRRWFVSEADFPSQAELLRGRARSAVPQLLMAISALNDRRSGKSDRSSDYQTLARWFAQCVNTADAHRLYRAAFALSPARHLVLVGPSEEVRPNTHWADAPPVQIHPKLRERGSLSPRGPAPRIRDRSQEKELLALQIADEEERSLAAQARLATGKPVLLSELGFLDAYGFKLLLSVIGEAIAAQRSPDDIVERTSNDGLLRIRLDPLGPETWARVETELGVFSGRDQRLTLTRIGGEDP